MNNHLNFKKIVVLGPESTGKSTLCAQLAKNYHTIYCEEYARAYLSKEGTKYNYENLKFHNFSTKKQFY
mgnify:CR=1 FL=1